MTTGTSGVAEKTRADSFLDRYPLVQELKLPAPSRDPRLLGRALRELCDQLPGSETGRLPFWYARKDGGLLVGLHAPQSQHPDVRERLRSSGYTTADLPAGSLPWLLGRLPAQIPPPLASSLLATFTAGCELAVDLLTQVQEGPAATWDRILSCADFVRAAFKASAIPEATLAAYAVYHRDWIVRFPLLRGRGSEAKSREILELLAQRAAALAEAVAAGGAMTAAQRARDSWNGWTREVATACSLAGEDPVLPDPFAFNSRFPILLQALHVLASALDLQPLEEALALTLVAREEDSSLVTTSIVLTRPPLEPEPVFTSSLPAGTTSLAGHRAPWMLLVEAGSSGGRELVRSFLENSGEAYERCVESLMLLRRHELGAERLQQAAALLEEIPGSALSETGTAGLLLGRFYYGSKAYYHYCRGDLKLAEETLEQARASLCRAIDLEPSLAPCAPLNSDIPLQRARIAKRRRDWAQVERELALLADMESGRQPLHGSAGGVRSISYEDIGRLCLENDNLSEEQREIIRRYLAPAYRILQLNHWIRNLYFPKDLFLIE